ncbi:MAG: hypothetical protein JSV86_08355 [Gemmatimonadota bacterium]|nr:MAG: hypothetical protein JSV86_08355 [Gemmatimonadota bacterium]
MTTQAVPIAPTVWVLDKSEEGDVWVTLDREEVEERLSARDRYILVDELGALCRETGWTIEVEIGSDRYRLTWGWETGPDEDSRIPDPGSGR